MRLSTSGASLSRRVARRNLSLSRVRLWELKENVKVEPFGVLKKDKTGSLHRAAACVFDPAPPCFLRVLMKIFSKRVP